MNKKIVATAIACVLGTSCLFAVAACNDVNKGDNKTIQVTAEQWAEAFYKTKNAANFTAKIAIDSNYSDSNFSNEVQNYYLTENTFAADLTIKRGQGTETEEAEGKAYAEKDSGLWYVASYSADEGYWYVMSPQTNLYYMQTIYSTFTIAYSTSIEYTDTDTLDKMYSAFTYSDGAYKATLYYLTDPDSATPIQKQDLEVKFNDGGYVSYIGISYSENRGNSAFTASYSLIFSNFGTTTVTENAEAKKEITDFKAENSKS